MTVAEATVSRTETESSAPSIFLMTDSFDTGGSERQFAALVSSLDGARFRVQVGCIQKRGGFLEKLGEVTEFPLAGSLYNLRSLRTRWRLAGFLRQSRVVIAQAFDFYTNLMLIPAARMARVPVVIGSMRQLGDLLTPAKRRAQLAVLRWCDSVVCNSQAAANRLIEDGISTDRLAVIGNGLPASAFGLTAPALPRRFGLLRVGMIARMNSPSKNHRSFLRAAARLRGRYPDVEFVLVGDGPLRPALEREAKDLGIGGQVQFLGDRRDISAILASIDISVLPSESESLSNAIIESMAAGVPVVASRVGGNLELIDESRGSLVAPGNDEVLAAEMERLLRDPSMRAAMSISAKGFATANFTIAQMRKRHEELYAELLSQKQKAHASSRLVTSQGAGAKTRPLRVAVIAPSLRYVGGQSVQADLLMTSWRKDPAVEARLIVIDPPFPGILRWAEEVPFLRTLVREPLYLRELWRGCANADVAHIFAASYWSFLLAPAAAWVIASSRGTKTLIHYHSGEARDHLRRFHTARKILARADRLVVPSQYLVDVFQEFGLAAQALPNMVDLSRFSFRVREPIRPHLVCTRGFHPYYGVDVAVRAFGEVKRAFPQACLDLVGGGPQEELTRNLVKQLGLDDVSFTGIISRQEIGKVYDQADIFINGSRLDNMPVSILEAFASGTPVVSTGPEGMRYVIEHERTGLLSEPDDFRALAQNVIRLLREPGLGSRIAATAYEESERYRWTVVREEWLEVYRSLARPDCEAVRGLASVA
jgi:glycosyltransferase involved in cell wall biosynthesis